MRFENCNGVKGLSGANHSEPKTVLSGRMPYVVVRENAVNWWTTVQGLNLYEVSLIYAHLTLINIKYFPNSLTGRSSIYTKNEVAFVNSSKFKKQKLKKCPGQNC